MAFAVRVGRQQVQDNGCPLIEDCAARISASPAKAKKGASSTSAIVDNAVFVVWFSLFCA
ncbi:hypothetical protein H7H48_00270 [Nitratireductor sp. B36]|uniref:hypothetical protein n=1 Tax=Nitratireductor sp. B36 TaxID=2762059 RepID=UPI001E624C18|nr:hypothetical protein [Nitratireductor sp. B36]MCC5777468.1 hypothetical protein [Nitratireductor sp. B36]